MAETKTGATTQLDGALMAMRHMVAVTNASFEGASPRIQAAILDCRRAIEAIRDNATPVFEAPLADMHGEIVGSASISYDDRGVSTDVTPRGTESPYVVVNEIHRGASLLSLSGAGGFDDALATIHMDARGVHLSADMENDRPGSAVLVTLDEGIEHVGPWEPQEVASHRLI